MRKILTAFFLTLLLAAPTLAQPVGGAYGPGPRSPSAVGVAAVGQIPGTATNDSAGAGDVGEYVSSTLLVGNEVTLPAVTGNADITSIPLTAGDWNVWGTICYDIASTTQLNILIGWISTSTATLPTTPNAGAFFWDQFSNSGGLVTGAATKCYPVGTQRVSLSGSGTAYLSTRNAFITSTLKGYGFIAARRVR